MLRKMTLLAVMSTLAFGMSATAYADSSVVLRVVTVKTDDVATYLQEIGKARVMVKRLALPTTIRVWQATFAGPNTGTIIVSQEYPNMNMAALADGTAKIAADEEYSQWLKNLNKIRTVISDSLYKEL